MAPRLPKKSDLNDIDKSLGDISVKLDNISRLEDVFKIDPQPWDDVSVSIDRVAKVSDKLANQLGNVARSGKRIKDELSEELRKREKIRKSAEDLEQTSQEIAKKIKDNLDQQKKLNISQAAQKKILKDLQKEQKTLEKNQRAIIKAYEQEEEQLTKIEDSVSQLEGKISELPTPFMLLAKLIGGRLFDAFDRVGKAVLTIGIDSLFAGMEKAEAGIKRVYELFERWTKALGALNMQIGALSPNMQGFNKMAREWEGQIRGLTDTFGEGLAMAGDFVKSFGRILSPNEMSKWGKLGIQIARGLGIGADAAGAILKSMYQIEETPDQARKAFGDIVAGANAAGISVNQFAGEVADARGFMIQFGQVGQKVFINAAARAKQLGLSIKALQQLTDLTDTFDSATEAAARMNTVFGTSINSLDLMLEQDPSKRLETVRNQLLSQGKTFDKLSRSEVKFMAQTLQLSEEEVAGVLRQGKTLDQFHKDQEKAKAKQLKDDQLLRKAQTATAQTMFAFGQAFDMITGHLIKLIRPFTDLLGLTGEFDKDGKRINNTFGGIMSRIFGKLATTIDAVASNPDFQKFVKMVAVDLKDAFEEVMAYLGDGKDAGIQGAISGAVDFMKMFYNGAKKAIQVIWSHKDGIVQIFRFMVDNAGTILKIWAGAKLFSGLMGVVSGINGTINLVQWATGSTGVMTLMTKFGSALQAASGTMLGKAGFVAAAGLAGWEIGRFIGSLQVGGKSIDDWVVTLFESISDLGNRLWKAFKESKLGSYLGLKDSGADIAKKLGISEQTLQSLQGQFFKIKQGTASENQMQAFKDIAKANGDDFIEMMAKSLGVSESDVTDVVNQARKASKVSVTPPVAQKVPSVVTGAPGRTKNQHGVAQNGGGKTQLVAGDVYLDGKKVGRHMARQLLSEDGG
jgi:hypothetical protein